MNTIVLIGIDDRGPKTIELRLKVRNLSKTITGGT
jgi:hypothetical protein